VAVGDELQSAFFQVRFKPISQGLRPECIASLPRLKVVPNAHMLSRASPGRADPRISVLATAERPRVSRMLTRTLNKVRGRSAQAA
jgi:hypothetical protein